MDIDKYRNHIFFILIIAIVLLGIYLVYYINTESFECLSEPYAYPIKLLEKANDADVSCYCSNSKNNQQIILTSEGIRTPYNSQGIEGINVSNIKFQEAKN